MLRRRARTSGVAVQARSLDITVALLQGRARERRSPFMSPICSAWRWRIAKGWEVVLLLAAEAIRDLTSCRARIPSTSPARRK